MYNFNKWWPESNVLTTHKMNVHYYYECHSKLNCCKYIMQLNKNK